MSEVKLMDSNYNCDFKIDSDLVNHIKNLLSEQADPVSNLGTYTTSRMDSDISEMFECLLPYNKVNYNEYFKIKEMESFCLSFILDMINAPDKKNSFGISTNGSSEAILLACLAWRERSKNKKRKNIIISQEAHSSWVVAAKILDIDVKEISFRLTDLEQNISMAIDDETIGVGVTLGTTSTGSFEPVEKTNEILNNYNKKHGRCIPIHVDAASGGFIAPFIDSGFIWDFRLNLVESINISGHKYGMVYPSIGWVFWKEKSKLSEGMGMSIEYLKDNFIHIGVNFSAPAAYIVAQYYSLKKYGNSGYRDKVRELFCIKKRIEHELNKISWFNIISTDTRHRLPVVCWTLSNNKNYEAVSKMFEKLGWIIPYCKISRGGETNCFRIVVRHNFSKLEVDKLISDLSTIQSTYIKEENEQ
ncbi:aminotransferase class V-fold PLP-dependent enzyme [Serratia fonticola]|uniref:glutamate decarboxylase n=1 Tax=Serratia fonticola TaxID=47917 RepID=A0AAW3WS46_SERFO|nr:aminotransferase class V-fold PLP-dependent enzyme [Serratia fonticola]MBC3212442.1 aminotransferase class V-fold PLP-dependent enzyme [Serratia fonticola]NYA12980.1 aminotransferase class V-fold PLP-dependent enzyme [Serratia fonticola]NYA32558.1 aminotransferase class V-fold PLP-dependent enzyme [Serratia fonticola]